MDIGFSALDRRRIEGLVGLDFEAFCEELVRYEADQRHDDAQVDGHQRHGVGDGGKDLRLVLKAPPRSRRAAFEAALTEDDLTETFFSCKSGSGWEGGVKKDAARRDGAARVLARGGRLTILLSRPEDIEKLTTAPLKTSSARRKKCFVRQVAEIAAKAMAGMRKRLPTVDEIERRITVYDANTIVAFLRAHRPSLSARFKAALGVVEPPGIIPLAQWRAEQRRGVRALPRFEPDDERQRLISQVIEMIQGGSERAMWIVGPPGIGKTRLVIEALAMAGEHERRICVAPREPSGAEAIERHAIVAKMPETILVIDECPAMKVGALYTQFAAAVELCGEPDPRARLILIGPPGDGQVPDGVREVRLGRLDEGALGRMIHAQFAGASSEAVDTILRLSEGYPWYAVLLTREFRDREDVLRHVQNTRAAAKLAIAPWREDEARWNDVVYPRARALLAVILTERRAWRSLDDHERQALCDGVGLASWTELRGRLQECDHRGLLRQSEDTEFRYVTPAVLVREVVSLLLAPPDGSGPDLRKHVPALADGLFDRLTELGVSPDIQRELARQELETWRRGAADLPALTRLATARAMLFAARRCPEEAVLRLSMIVEATSQTTLASNGFSSAATTLGHLISRRGCFARAERALFRLVVAERGESMRPATDRWALALVPSWGEAYASVTERLDVLAERVHDADPLARSAALAALERVADFDRWWSAHDPLDGDYAPLDPPVVRAATTSAWRLLAERTGDSDPAVAGRARRAVVRYLRGAIRAGLANDALAELTSLAFAWNASEQAALRAVLDLVDVYDSSFVEAAPDAPTRLTALRHALTPRSYHERLLDRVAHWRPRAAGADTERDADLAVAREGLAGDAPLVRELDWLDSLEARRAHVFVGRVGEVDHARVTLPLLVARECAGSARNPLLLPKYLKGLSDVAGRSEVDALLRSWRAESTLARATLLAVWLLGASDESTTWILDDLRARRIQPAALEVLTSGSWDRSAPWATVSRLLDPLLASGDARAAYTALVLVDRRIDSEPSLAHELVAPLSRALVALVTLDAQDALEVRDEWERGMDQLAALGRGGEALEVAMQVIDRGLQSTAFEHAWRVARRLGTGDVATYWRRFSASLDRVEEASVAWDDRWRALLGPVPASEVMAWVGADTRRARLVARLSDVYSASLPPLPRALLNRFGRDGDVAATLLTCALSAPSGFGTYATFIRDQLDRALGWAQDSDADVAGWARRCAAELHAIQGRLPGPQTLRKVGS